MPLILLFNEFKNGDPPNIFEIPANVLVKVERPPNIRFTLDFNILTLDGIMLAPGVNL